jgi:hypothetical protein
LLVHEQVELLFECELVHVSSFSRGRRETARDLKRSRAER